MNPLIYCAIKATRDLHGGDEGESEVDEGRTPKTSLLRTVRQRALQILGRLFESCPDFAWQPYVAPIVKELVEPRLEKLPIETAQSISGLLKLFAAWSRSLLTAPFLVEHNPSILIKVIDCLRIESAKDEVKCFVLNDILREFISLVSHDHESLEIETRLLRNQIQSSVVQPYSGAMLKAVGDLLQQSPSKEVLEAGVQTIADLAPHLVGSLESRSTIEITTFLLRQPSKRVNHRTKLGLLKIIYELVKHCGDETLGTLFDNLYNAICPLFAFVQDRSARQLLCDILQELSNTREDLQTTARLCHSLNSFSIGRLDEPDFEQRSQAFDEINGEEHRSYSLMQWRPLVSNLLYFIRDHDELSIRVNASMSLRRFVDVAGTDEFKNFIATDILPGIHRGAQDISELVRGEFLAVLEHLVKTHQGWTPVADLYVLLSEHEESSFFSNILHIQNHRRVRALRRLAACASQLQSGNISHFMIPLLEHFVFSKADDADADSLLGETIKTMTVLTQGLEWPQFRSLCRRYIGYLKSKEDMQKPIIKLIAGMMDGLSRAGHEKGYTKRLNSKQAELGPSESAETSETLPVDAPLSTLAKTLPRQEKLTNDLANNLLPDLTSFLHMKDEATVSLRVPIAVAITKAIHLLPAQEIESTIACNALGYLLHSEEPCTRESRHVKEYALRYCCPPRRRLSRIHSQSIENSSSAGLSTSCSLFHASPYLGQNV